MGAITEKKTAEARRKILRLILDESLARGSKLPSCEELCTRFGLGASTVFAALKTLCDEGVLRSRNKVGIFVDDLRPGLFGYRVALLINGPVIPPFPVTLTYFIQAECLRKGCEVTFFSGSYRGDNSEQEDVFEVMPGLKRMFDLRLIDGIITLVSLSESNLRTFEKAGIPVCFAGGFLDRQTGEGAPSSCRFRSSIPAESFFRKGGRRMKELGAKRPVLLWPSDTHFASERFFREECGGKTVKGAIWTDIFPLVERILQMPRSEWPDAMLIPDDLVAQRLYANLAMKVGTAGLPHPVILAEAEIPVFLPVPTDRLEIRLTDLAGKAVEVLKSAMRNPGPEACIEAFTEPELRVADRDSFC